MASTLDSSEPVQFLLVEHVRGQSVVIIPTMNNICKQAFRIYYVQFHQQNNLQCMCLLGVMMAESQRKPFSAPSLNTVSKDLICINCSTLN